MTRLHINMAKQKPLWQLSLLGMLGALALALSYLEGLLPAFPFLPPGAKPGFSNIITMLTAYAFGFPQALYITLLKALFAGLTRGLTAFLLSLTGGLCSTALLGLLLRLKKGNVSALGLSLPAALLHNLGQLCMAILLSSSLQLGRIAPVLLLFSLGSGIVTGFAFQALLPALQRLLRHYAITPHYETENPKQTDRIGTRS